MRKYRKHIIFLISYVIYVLLMDKFITRDLFERGSRYSLAVTLLIIVIPAMIFYLIIGKNDKKHDKN